MILVLFLQFVHYGQNKKNVSKTLDSWKNIVRNLVMNVQVRFSFSLYTSVDTLNHYRNRNQVRYELFSCNALVREVSYFYVHFFLNPAGTENFVAEDIMLRSLGNSQISYFYNFNECREHFLMFWNFFAKYRDSIDEIHTAGYNIIFLHFTGFSNSAGDDFFPSAARSVGNTKLREQQPFVNHCLQYCQNLTFTKMSMISNAHNSFCVVFAVLFICFNLGLGLVLFSSEPIPALDWNR